MKDILMSILLTFALIGGFSYAGVEVVEEPHAAAKAYISGSEYSPEGIPAKPAAASEPVLKLVRTVVEEPMEVTEPVTPAEPEVAYFDVPLSEDLQDYIFEVCETYEIDPAVVVAVIWKESTYKASAMGDNGKAYGLMQVQPRWHRDRMKRLGVTDLLDPYQNILVGVDYLAELYHDRGSMKWALMAYNGGPDYANRMTRAGRVSSYASAVLKKSKELK